MGSPETTSVPAGLVEPEELERYAETIVRHCLDLAEDDLLLVDCELPHRDLAIALADAGYRAGARYVEVTYGDRRVQAARVRHAKEEHLGTLSPWARRRVRTYSQPDTAVVTVLGEADPGAFAGLPPDRLATEVSRLARASTRAVRGGGTGGKLRWCGVAWPSPAWASQAYPGEEPDEAQRLLARDLLHFCHLGPDDPPDLSGWRGHVDRLAARNLFLSELGLDRLELRAPGTELDLRLVEGGRWLGGPRPNRYGRVITPNFPTEENFTSPDPAGTEGTFRCTRPLSFRGRLIEGIAGEFRGGRLVRLEANDPDDRDFFAAVLDTDHSGRRLGEVALVDGTSRIGEARRVYWNTLIDENAVAHIAFGRGFPQTRPDAEGRWPRRLNRSAIHIDVMIGGDDLEATGVTTDGRRVPLIAGGRWQVP